MGLIACKRFCVRFSRTKLFVSILVVNGRVGPLRVGPLHVGPLRVGPLHVGPLRVGSGIVCEITYKLLVITVQG